MKKQYKTLIILTAIMGTPGLAVEKSTTSSNTKDDLRMSLINLHLDIQTPEKTTTKLQLSTSNERMDKFCTKVKDYLDKMIDEKETEEKKYAYALLGSDELKQARAMSKTKQKAKDVLTMVQHRIQLCQDLVCAQNEATQCAEAFVKGLSADNVHDAITTLRKNQAAGNAISKEIMDKQKTVETLFQAVLKCGSIEEQIMNGLQQTGNALGPAMAKLLMEVEQQVRYATENQEKGKVTSKEAVFNLYQKALQREVMQGTIMNVTREAGDFGTMLMALKKAHELSTQPKTAEYTDLLCQNIDAKMACLWAEMGYSGDVTGKDLYLPGWFEIWKEIVSKIHSDSMGAYGQLQQVWRQTDAQAQPLRRKVEAIKIAIKKMKKKRDAFDEIIKNANGKIEFKKIKKIKELCFKSVDNEIDLEMENKWREEGVERGELNLKVQKCDAAIKAVTQQMHELCIRNIKIEGNKSKNSINGIMRDMHLESVSGVDLNQMKGVVQNMKEDIRLKEEFLQHERDTMKIVEQQRTLHQKFRTSLSEEKNEEVMQVVEQLERLRKQILEKSSKKQSIRYEALDQMRKDHEKAVQEEVIQADQDLEEEMKKLETKEWDETEAL